MIIKHNPEGVFPPYRNYSHAVEITGDSRLLIVSGLNGYLSDGQTMPESFAEQGEMIWQHIGTILGSAGMDYQNIVSVRTYLAEPFL
jgi:enamine deaminase RidA (YjgF/YER057c/UK114 family)